ncbi:MFS transporter [Aldersonia sp. NBC_00410]|jgi:MFS family permease|uniref:MFS transporter n=1 Tax=Aldersonia sp. NBC_00410 TaxID=2975954 RepID=UPI002259D1A5|nr:MFS transporter [Aldersonia sp. NBC_00410]MCX5041992.1 MFS transporter [Aldersonia sp. NBC_00410]
MKRAWSIWIVGVFAYVIAVLNRTAFGVSGLQAQERFAVDPSVLASFVVLQVIVYAGMQIPAGLLLDRLGSRTMIATGAIAMAAGETVLALTGAVPVAVLGRVLVGTGDAFTFLAVLRLVPEWFAPRRVPLVSQLTGILGQFGQVLSAVPLLALLRGPGWETAFLSAAAVGVLSCCLALAVIKDSPHPAHPRVGPSGGLRELRGQIATVWRRPGTRLGFFSHMGTQFSITTFALMWGVPYLVSAQGLSLSAAGGMLTVSVLSAVIAGPILGLLTGRYPLRRSWLVLGSITGTVTMWTIVLSLPHPAPVWLLVALVVVISVGGPGSVIGFDYARTSNPSTSMGTAQGMVNVGGFAASLVTIEVIGIVLDRAGGLTFDAFRLAWLVQYPIWALAIVGVLISRTTARREAALQGIHVKPLREVVARIRRRSRS